MPDQLPQEQRVVAQQPGQAHQETPRRAVEFPAGVPDPTTGLTGMAKIVTTVGVVGAVVLMLGYLVYNITEAIPARKEKATENIGESIDKAINAAQVDSERNRQLFEKAQDRSDAINKRINDRHREDHAKTLLQMERNGDVQREMASMLKAILEQGKK